MWCYYLLVAATHGDHWFELCMTTCAYRHLQKQVYCMLHSANQRAIEMGNDVRELPSLLFSFFRVHFLEGVFTIFPA